MPLASVLAARLAEARSGQKGQGLAEYSLLLAFIAMMAIAGLMILGVDITTTLNSIATTVASVRQ